MERRVFAYICNKLNRFMNLFLATMKKKLLIMSSLATLAGISFVAFSWRGENRFSDVILTNTDAIARGEGWMDKGPGSLQLCGRPILGNETESCLTTVWYCPGMKEPCQEVECSQHEK